MRHDAADIARARDRDLVIADDARRSARQHQRTVAERDRLGDVVGDEDDGLAAEVPEPQEILLQLHPRLRVERAERLVHQDHRRIVDQRADQRGALAHAAGQVRADNGSRSRRARRRGSASRRARGSRRSGDPGRRAETARSAASCATAGDCPPASRSRSCTTGPGLSAFGSPSGAVCDWKRTSPPLAASICAIMFRSVVLPEPEGPMMVRNSPSLDREAQVLNHRTATDRGRRGSRSACRDRGLREAAAAMVKSPPACVMSAGGRQRSSRRSITLTLQVADEDDHVIATSATKTPMVSKFMAPSWIR